MTLTLNQLLPMVGRSIQNPREGAAEVLALGVPKEALWLILATVVVLSVLLAKVTTLLVGGGGAMFDGMLANPITMGIVQFVILIIMVTAVYWVGRAMGGTGSFEESILLMSWLQFIMVVIQVAQTLAMLILPPVAGLIGIAALVLFFWLLTNFVAVLHGFKSLGQVFVMIIVSAFTIAFVLSLVLALLGVGVTVNGGV